jgi:hypothetical protein
MKRGKIAFALVVLVATADLWAQRIRIESFTLQPSDGNSGELKPGDAFEVGVRVTNNDAGLVTYVLRTVEPVTREDAPPALDHYEPARSFAFLSESGKVQLSDGGPHDLDPATHAFLTRLCTAGWKPGRYELGLFAHNSTSKKHDRYEVAKACFSVEVTADRVRLIDRQNPSLCRIRHALFRPEAVIAGETAVLSVAVTGPGLVGLGVATPLRLAPEGVLPDFRYDAETHTARLADRSAEWVLNPGAWDTQAAEDVIEVPLRTDGKTPGLYFVTVVAHTQEGRPDERHIALRIKSPTDRLRVTVSAPWIVWEGSSAGRFTRLPDGALIYGNRLSTDQGRTWQRLKGGGLSGGCPVLNDGRVLALDYSLLPIEGRTGWYSATLRSSRDGGRTIRREPVQFHVPPAKAARGHAQHQGPLCTGSFVQRDDGSLLALMMGWFVGDDALCPYGRGRPYSRTYVCESVDGGRVWTYLATVGYGEIGSEGYNEGAIQKLPNGEIVSVMRTGNMTDTMCQDNPVMVSRSGDGGRSWKKPWRTGVNGAYPDVALLSDGMLALSTGRPGAYVLFSSDNGDTWHDLTLVDAADHSGYTALIETRPGELLVAFSEGYLRPGIENAVRMAYVRYCRYHTTAEKSLNHLTGTRHTGGPGSTPAEDGVEAVPPCVWDRPFSPFTRP